MGTKPGGHTTACRRPGQSPGHMHTHKALQEGNMYSCISGDPSPSRGPKRFHSYFSLYNGKHLLKVSCPTTLAPELSPPPLIDGHLGQRWSGLLSPRTALLGSPGGPSPLGICYHFHLTATSTFDYNSASLGSHTESKVCTPGVSENSYVWL